MAKYEAVIGIECHVELKTATKMFCGCANEFGGEPNTKVCPVCLGMPGALPVPNATAIEHTIAAGLAFGAEIPAFSKWDRKNYFYPDMPKDYQISQYDMPLTHGGVVRYWLEDGAIKECRLTRIHLEEDTGKSTHAGSGDGRIAGSSYSLVDFNRAGRSADGVRLGTGDSQRRRSRRLSGSVAAHVAAARRERREDGGRLAALRCQRFRATGRDVGVRYEDRNQEHELVPLGPSRDRKRDRAPDRNHRIGRARRCRRRAAGTKPTASRVSMRSKEEAHDYRYFPDPDLVPMEISRELVDGDPCARCRSCPWQRFERYTAQYGINVKQATQLVDNLPLATYFDAVVDASGNPQQSRQLRSRRPFAPRERDTDVRWRNRRSRPTISPSSSRWSRQRRSTRRSPRSCSRACGTASGSPKSDVEREGLAQTSDPAGDREIRRRGAGGQRKVGRRLQSRQDERRRLPRRSDHEGVAWKSRPGARQELLKKKLE